jgi:hypothetical protein
VVKPEEERAESVVGTVRVAGLDLEKVEKFELVALASPWSVDAEVGWASEGVTMLIGGVIVAGEEEGG